MTDAFERRALLIHLGDVLEAMNSLLERGKDRAIVRELAAENESLAGRLLLMQIAPQMTSREFFTRAVRAFSIWPQALLDADLDEERLVTSVQENLFPDNPDGWLAYVAAMQTEVPWFGKYAYSDRTQDEASAGLAANDLDSATEDQAERTVDVERNGAQAEVRRESVESTVPIYPSWPWKTRP
ncbi:hypothetical protein [Paraburkholderia elongata]|uniref:Uncharacterized protein n=1 Tax=Paraburkholderia elongata TaxID=2675747 RepID=A0A972SHN5_9BURK|nr:hypothetical protein [Paraburkholderia elongata]NPT56158.1 hypothetical protein [Paraburkholderia elongata]